MSDSKKIIFNESNIRFDRWLDQQYPGFPHNFWLKALKNGDVKLNGTKCKFNCLLQTSDEITLSAWLQQKITSNPPKLKKTTSDLATVPGFIAAVGAIASHIIFENNDFVVVNKPAGLASQRGSGVKFALDDLMNHRYQEQQCESKILHRLDKNTSGLILFAKNLATAQVITKLFADHKIHKTYLAISNVKIGTPSELITLPLVKTSNGNVVVAKPNNESATVTRTRLKTLKHSREMVLYLLKPQTGFKHQLRVTLKHLGAPIIGDQRYHPGYFKKSSQPMYLHAWKLEFKLGHNKYQFQAPLPHYWPSAMSY